MFNHLPENIKKLSNNIVPFRLALKGFLYANSFYTVEEFFKLWLNTIFDVHGVLLIFVHMVFLWIVCMFCCV
jgi:hypothetical protein